MTIWTEGLDFQALGERIRHSQAQELELEGVLGQRYIGAGLRDKRLRIRGVPGNALGAYMDGAQLRVEGNAQDAVGDTMNDGEIVVEGSCGDALGYAMRGGSIFVRGNVGYRCGIHMKAYREKQPRIVIGGRAGSFLGEYQAGGRILVLGLGLDGGAIFLRCRRPPQDLPAQVTAKPADGEELRWLQGDLRDFCQRFGLDPEPLLADEYWCLRPNTENPYKRLYTPY